MSPAALAVLSAVLGAQPPPCASRTYDGPLGLRWGQSSIEVMSALKDRFSFADDDVLFDEDRVALVAEGDFAGRRTELVAFLFEADRLTVVLVALPEADQRPASRRWQELVDELRSAHGPPTKIAATPALPGDAVVSEAKKRPALRRSATLLESLTGGAYRDALLDVEIQSGRWEPRAEWRFRNATIAVGVSASEPDDFGTRSLRVQMAFGENRHMDAGANRAKIRDY